MEQRANLNVPNAATGLSSHGFVETANLLLRSDASWETNLQRQYNTDTSVRFYKDVFSQKSAELETVFYTQFCEFGCETVSAVHILPRILSPNQKNVVVGWSNRKYLYEQLFDEYWKIDNRFSPLRSLCHGLSHSSNLLSGVEASLQHRGRVIRSQDLSSHYTTGQCVLCGYLEKNPYVKLDSCPRCGSTQVRSSLLSDPVGFNLIRDNRLFLKPKPRCRDVAIFARGRPTYGRNLSSNFYTLLANKLEEWGYQPLFFGEAVSTQKLSCHYKSYVGIALSEAIDILSGCSFSVQCFTASTRLSSFAGIPSLLVETPEQLWGSHYLYGQEGRRLLLMKNGGIKLIPTHFVAGQKWECEIIDRILKSVSEIEAGNYKPELSDDFRFRNICRNRLLQDNSYENEIYQPDQL